MTKTNTRLTSPPPAMGTNPAIIGNNQSHDTLRRILQTKKPSKVLDVPSGHGALTQVLLKLGWDVHCADIDAGHLQVEGVPFTQVDLNRRLPFDNESFDAVACINGIHRLFNPGGALQEFHRILRPGGSLFLNLNNYSALHRRVRFLLFGMMDPGGVSGVCKQTIDAPEAHVRYPLVLPQLTDMLRTAGFETINILPASKNTILTIATPVALGIRLVAQMIPWPGQKDRIKVANSSGAFPGGRYLFIEARKLPRSKTSLS